ncbi:hypothetical protein ACH5RR_009254 [Cinchona calisaya]|uniref:Uncharacterized protein n=1 Tax=Cinchona calisaya TaxID=153742 RepID=A0ABD3ADX0_9GENT
MSMLLWLRFQQLCSVHLTLKLSVYKDEYHVTCFVLNLNKEVIDKKSSSINCKKDMILDNIAKVEFLSFLMITMAMRKDEITKLHIKRVVVKSFETHGQRGTVKTH